jgi:hypothetical protein
MANAKQEQLATEMTTGEIRVSFPQVWAAKAFRGGDPKYSCILMIPKTDKKTVSKILACIEEAKLDGKTSKWKGIIPKSLDNPLHDGDEQFALGKKGEEFKGHWYMNAKSSGKPYIFDEAGNEVLDQTKFYAGCYAKAAINFFPYDNAGQGVGVGLNGMKKTRDGVAFSGRPSLEKVQGLFDEEDDSEV